MNRPTIQQQGNSSWEQLFAQLPEERLPMDFRATLMQKVMRQAAIKRKRNERLSWLAYLDFSWTHFELFKGESYPFYCLIGVLALLLLMLDYKLRQLYFSHKKM